MAHLVAPLPLEARCGGMLTDTSILRLLGAFLIANSHLEILYPRPWMAGDGLMGNSLFLLISGFGLVLSDEARPRSFLPWYWRRLTRIYPSVFIALLILAWGPQHGWRTWSPARNLSEFIWPTRYGFIAGIVLFYIVFFFIMKARNARVYAILIAALFVPLAWLYLRDIRTMPPAAPLHLGVRPVWIQIIYYFQVMLLGGWLASIPQHKPGKLLSHGLLFVTLFTIYAALKFGMVKGFFPRFYAGLFLLCFGMTYALFRLAQTPALVRLQQGPGVASALIQLGAGIALEIYVVHEFVAFNGKVKTLPFPANLAVFWLATLGLSLVVARLASLSQSWLRDRSAWSEGIRQPVG